MNKFKYLWGAVFIFVGIFLTFLGRKLIKPAICLMATGATVFLVMFFFYGIFLSNNTETWVGWVVLSVAIIVGSILGLLLAKLTKLGVAVLAGWGGVALALVLWSAFIYKSNSQAVFWIILVAFALIFGGLSFCLFDHMVILATSFAGSYAVMRGISFYAGHYPNEFTLYEMIKNGAFTDIDPIFYAYFTGIIVLFILGACVQYRMKSNHDNAKRHPYHRFR